MFLHETKLKQTNTNKRKIRKKELSFFSGILYSSTHIQTTCMGIFCNVFPCVKKKQILKSGWCLYLGAEFGRCINIRNSPRDFVQEVSSFY